jgi:membrane protein DedA with SNARE-associated domain
MADWVVSFIEHTGYAGIALLMFLENVFPPIPSEVIMPFAGLAVARGELAAVWTVVAGSAGAIAGASIWYAVGRRVGSDRAEDWVGRHSRWLTFTPEQIERAEKWFRRHGPGAVFLGRLIPALRTVISMPAGLACMTLPRFLFWTSLGCVVWTACLTAAGVFLGHHYEAVERYVHWAANLIIAGAVAAYVWRLVKRRPAKDGSPR